MHMRHFVLGGPEPESAKEACSQETADVAAGYVSAKEVSLTRL